MAVAVSPVKVCRMPAQVSSCGLGLGCARYSSSAAVYSPRNVRVRKDSSRTADCSICEVFGGANTIDRALYEAKRVMRVTDDHEEDT